jgi:dihydropteroate synthase
MSPAPLWRLRDRSIDLDQPLAVGIVNVTADSMFAGARSGTPERAIADGQALAEAGFDMLDVGAVAARSGPDVPAADEAGALLPALEGLAPRGLPLSADTFTAEVARRALDAGAVAINDIGGGSTEMLELVAASGCGYVLMHIEGPPRVDRRAPGYGDVVEHLKRWFGERLEQATARGVGEEQIVLDPGLDFDLSTDHDLEVLRRLEELTDLGRPLYVSLSRKDFIGALLAGSWERRRPAEEREWGTAAAASLAVAAGARILRLHDRSALQAVRVAGRIGSPAPAGAA